ncbi:hypothetical protein [Prochlorococcus marinus]|uniref:hypothetical protein n=1 Tax=Prochlorococcus marinus TaxID=1219 RepID=UPI001ADB6F67|nr:hypothetical protein [Prochlorococcus marinus]MBO8204245.1 hypothetical protein [Prochlorococcus marinus CUG1415]
MELVKFSRNLKYLLLLFSPLILNAGLVKSSDLMQFSGVEKITSIDFDNLYFENTISFEDYDSYSHQFDNFFGMNYLETENKRNFQDLSISFDSKKIRDLYEYMLEGHTNIKKISKDKEVFYKKKI